MAETTKRLVLKFPKSSIDQPIVYRLIKDFDLIFNILKAKITPDEEGFLVIELIGEEKNVNKGLDYLKGLNVEIEPFSKEVTRDDKRCTHCTTCVPVCPTKALDIPDRKTMKVEYDNEKCIACEACVEVCPYKAMKVKY
ncbi:4Fe-4S dicluster domain-containing protein [Candidatus Woesearchaeota archaeon]|nr:4Fe-4S dicluster domain-containing protein [Candidatus Woesearchaeota archaeon]